MKKTSTLNYAFAVGKIRALETFLIRSEVFQAAIESELAEALKLFVESGRYNEELLHIKDSAQLEALLNQELLKLKKLICDLLLDKGLVSLTEFDNLKDAQDIIRSYQSDFLEDYINYLIDLHNIKSFLRLYILKEPQEELGAILTCEGFIQRETFLKLYGQDLSVFLHRLEYVHKDTQIINYAEHLSEAVKKLEKEDSFVSLEKAINDFLLQILKLAKYLSFGPEAVLAYYFAKVNEINLFRMVILAKLNNVSSDLIKERLNVVYA